jgi:hypothetical protein
VAEIRIRGHEIPGTRTEFQKIRNMSPKLKKGTVYQAVDWIIDHLQLSFSAEKPPPSRVFQQVALMAAEERGQYF